MRNMTYAVYCPCIALHGLLTHCYQCASELTKDILHSQNIVNFKGILCPLTQWLDYINVYEVKGPWGMLGMPSMMAISQNHQLHQRSSHYIPRTSHRSAQEHYSWTEGVQRPNTMEIPDCFLH